MARLKYTHNSFSVGLINKGVQGNTEFDGYNNALDECDNFLVNHTGGCSKRCGTIHTHSTKPILDGNNNIIGYHECIIIPFSIDSFTTYLIEVGDKYMRFFTHEGPVLSENGDVYELAHNYQLKDIRLFPRYQDKNILAFVANDGIKFLIRKYKDDKIFFELKDEAFTVAPMDPNIPVSLSLYPYKSKLLTDVKTKDRIKLDHIKFNAIITDSSVPTYGYNENLVDEKTHPVFQFSLISGYQTKSDISEISATKDIEFLFPYIKTGDYLTLNYYSSDGKKTIYLEVDAKQEELIIQNAQTHIIEEKYASQLLVHIDKTLSPSEYITKTENNVEKLITVHKLPTTAPVTNYNIPAKLGENGKFAQTGALYDGRLFLSYKNTIWGSAIEDNDHFNFKLGGFDGDAVMHNASLMNADDILWIVPQSKLFIGTRSGIYLAGSASYNDDPITPYSFRTRLFDKVGASPLYPVVALDSVFFVDSLGVNVHEIVLSNETKSFKAQDLSLLANDLTESGIIAHCWQENPSKTYWCAVNKGHLCALTYLKSNGILAWSKHTIGGKNTRVEDVCCVNRYGASLVFMVVKRQIGNIEYRSIEYISTDYQKIEGEDFKQHYSDCGQVYEEKLIIDNITINKNASISIPKDNNSRLTVDLVNQRFGNKYYVAFYDKKNTTGLENRKYFLKDLVETDTHISGSMFECIDTIDGEHLHVKMDYENYSNVENHAMDLYFLDSSIYKFVNPNIGSRDNCYIECDNSYLNNYDSVIFFNTGLFLRNPLDNTYSSIDYDKNHLAFFSVEYMTLSDNIKRLYLTVASKVYVHLYEKTQDDKFKRITSYSFSDKQAIILKKVSNTCSFDRGTESEVSVIINSEKQEKIYKNLTSSDIYITNVIGMTEINNRKYYVAFRNPLPTTGDYPKIGVINLYDYSTSPGNTATVPLDTSNYSIYDKAVEENGNLYRYFVDVPIAEHLLGQEVDVWSSGNVVTQIIDPADAKQINSPKLITPKISKYYVGETKQYTGIKLNVPGIFVSVGLNYNSRIKTVPFSGGSVLGSSIGCVSSQKSYHLYVLKSSGGHIGTENKNMYEILYHNDQDVKFDKIKQLYSGLITGSFINSRNRYERVVIINHDTPEPFNLLSITQDVSCSDA